MNSLGHSNRAKVRVLINGLHAKSGGGVTFLRNILPRLADDERLEIHLILHIDQHALFSPLDPRLRLHEQDFNPGIWRLLIWEQFVLPIKARTISANVTFSPANYGPLLVPSPIIMLQNALAVAGIETRPAKRLYWAGLAFMTAISLFRCSRAIAVSRYAYKGLGFGLGRWFERKISVIYLGVNPIFSPGPKLPGISPYLLVVGDIYIQKNLHTLIEALKIIHNKFPALPLKIAGRRNDENYYDRLAGTIDRLGLRNSVEFLDGQNVDDLVTLYRNCAAFVLPSTVETFGIPLIEAMACGAPVATSNSAAMPEIVGNGAILFDPLDASDMADKIIRLLEDSAFARQVADLGKKQASKYSWDRTAQQTADILVEAAQWTDQKKSRPKGQPGS